MSRVTGNPAETITFGGEGTIYTGVVGDDLPDDGVLRHTVGWSATEEVNEVDVTDTRDYSESEDIVHPRSIITSRRLVGTMRFKYDPTSSDTDVLVALRSGNLISGQLNLNRGRVASAGPPALSAVQHCYFDCPEILIGAEEIAEADPQAVRMINVPFRTNGTYTYVREDAA